MHLKTVIYSAEANIELTMDIRELKLIAEDPFAATIVRDKIRELSKDMLNRIENEGHDDLSLRL